MSLSTVFAWSADGDSFTATTEGGVVLNFKVISEEAKTCQVGDNRNCVLSESGVLVIPEMANGYSVVDIIENAFHGCTNIKSVTISKNIMMYDVNGVSLGKESPFKNCSYIQEISIECCRFGDWFAGLESLKTVRIGSGVTEISDNALSSRYRNLSCSNIESIIVDAENTKFDSRDKCNAIIDSETNSLIFGCKTTVIPETITEIAETAFYNQSNLTQVTIPVGVTKIGDYAFAGCIGLQTVTSLILEPNNIYSNVFEDDTKSSATLRVPYLRSKRYKNLNGWDFETIVDMDGTVEEMTNIDFADPLTKKACVNEWDINNDGEISIGEARLVTEIKGFGSQSELESFDEISYFINVTTIGDAAFSGCKNLKEFIVPSKVTTIKRAAFAGCTSLASFVIPEGVTTINDQTFQRCSNLKSVAIPSTLTDIGNYAFENCSKLTSIDLPEGLKSIGNNAFYSAGLPKITIPSTVTSIGNNAFSVDIIYCNLTAPISIESIVYSPSNVILIVPAGCEEAFMNAAGWKDFMIANASNNEAIDWEEGQITVNIEEPGSLRLTIIELDDEEITRLKVKGSLNSEDIKYIVDSKSQGKLSKLESLDLSEVRLIYGGDAYASMTIVYDDVWPVRTDKTLFYLAETELIVGPGERVPGLGNYTDVTSFYGPDLAAAFAGGGYKHIVMPKSVTKVAKATFENCTNLQSVEFGGNLNSIDANAFKGCSSLKSFNLAGAESIGYEAFSGCTLLSTINGLEKVKQIGAEAFYGCKFLTGEDGVLSLTGLGTIKKGTFSGCKMISNVCLSENLVEIESEAFQGCKMLESISLPDGLKIISSNAFDGCSSLSNVVFSPLLMQVDHSAFNNTAWLHALPTENGIKYMGHIALCYDKGSNYASSSSTILSFREGTTYITDRFINSVHDANYQYVDHITGFQFPSTLKKIGDEAFINLPITSLTLPDGLEIIGKEAFASSKSLTKVTLPENLKQIGDGAFESCTSLNIVNYNTIHSEGKELFSGCSAIERVNIGSKVQLLPDDIFSNCTSLTIVKFAERDDATKFAIGDNAFYRCENLRDFDLPAATNFIGEGAFEGCIGFTSFTIPQGVTKVSNNMLAGCSSITSIQLHDGITSIGDNAFSDCNQVMSFSIPESVTSIGSYAFNGCYGLTELTIPSGVVELGVAFLSDCYNLTKLVSNMTTPLPVESVIPMSNHIVQEIYDHYYEWSAYTDIHYDEVTLIVPDGCKPLYKNTEGWNLFRNITEVSGNDISATNKFNVSINPTISGGKTFLFVGMENSVTDFTAYQADIILPVGFTLTSNGDDRYEVFKGERYDGNNHSISIEKLPDHEYARFNRYRIVCVSTQNSTITGKDGVLFTVKIDTPYNHEDGDYGATIENITLSRTDGVKCELDYVPFNITIQESLGELIGDVNSDETVDVSDAVATVNAVLNNITEPLKVLQYDVTMDGEVDVFDVTKIISIILSGRNNSRVYTRAMSDNSIIEDISLIANNDYIKMGINKAERFSAFQFDVVVPEGSELTDVVMANGNANHNIRFAKVNEGLYRVIGLSMSNEEFSPSSDNLINFVLSGKTNGDVRVENVVFVSTKGEKTFFKSRNINMIDVETEETINEVYDLQGHKLDVNHNQQRGVVYIINGKKVVNK